MFFVVVEVVNVVCEYGEDVEDFVFVDYWCGEDGVEGVVVWEIDEVEEFGVLDVGEIDLFVCMDCGGGEVGFDGEFDG